MQALKNCNTHIIYYLILNPTMILLIRVLTLIYSTGDFSYTEYLKPLPCFINPILIHFLFMNFNRTPKILCYMSNLQKNYRNYNKMFAINNYM